MAEMIKLDGEYVKIKNLNTISYGGNQNWCKTKKLQRVGCGVIAMADISIYLAEQNPTMMNADIRKINKPNGLFNKNDYIEYVRKFFAKYVYFMLPTGLTGLSLRSAMNRYFYLNHIKLKAKWKMFLSYDRMLRDIKHLLGKNKPVILSIGPNTPNLNGKKGIKFYVNQDDGLVTSMKENVHSHYVVVTGLKEIDRKPYLVIASWGREYYIDYKEYRDYVSHVGGTITSSILYIKGLI